MPIEVKAAIINLNSDIKYRVRMGKDRLLSVEFLLNIGVGQGCVLSPENYISGTKELNTFISL